MRKTLRIAPSLLVALGLAACSSQDAPLVGDANATPAGEAVVATAAAAAEPEPASGAAAAMSSDPGAITLDMARVEEMLGALAAIAKLHEADPSLEEVTTMDASEDIDTYVARLESHPQVAAAIASAGTTPRDFALTSSALTAAMFAQGMLEAGAIPELPEGINPQHVEFVKQNRDAISALMQDLAAG